ncbi:MAG TPA: hypothetical protein VER12_01795 [Polyangiaceae bacterium]|nr:hypothetical protein [Polyangiaceae bacterium]
MTTFVRRLMGVLLSSPLLCCCLSKTDAAPLPVQTLEFPISIAAHSERKSSVSGVEISLGKRLLGTTDTSGNAQFSLEGAEGDTQTLNVKCPAAYASPERPLLVGLRRLGNGSTRARFEVECFSLVHSVVVGVRAENGPHLPILRLKSVVGQTDEQGVAHVLLQASANEPIALTLDTSKNVNLMPQNPTLDFATGDSDEFLLVAQKFTVKHAPPRRVVPRAIPRHL